MNSTMLNSRANIIKEFHAGLLNRYKGTEMSSPMVCGWSSRESQEARFSALMRTLKYNGGSIVDYGCGTGDLYAFIVRHFGHVQYTGVDFHEGMLRQAKHKYNAEFIRCGFDDISFEPADFVVASGVFQFRDALNPAYYDQIVKDLFSKSRVALAVNFLSDTRQDSEEIDSELYLQPCQVVQLAASISPMWAIDHSYHVGFGDITMALFHWDRNQHWTRP
ncbi:MAG TPA: class I SAM-dependent methyltransferase [Bacteroidetes bacterium]|nr:trans-aconitate 2-methyltransferase [bacterium BMS3Bbin04]HDO66402.1 class I SAM-dependent methyltransferase [Bacteroidota bacterium]HEX05527.1 class I SAM-dependent methyltransferase [Bacteroidota bacterium]